MKKWKFKNGSTISFGDDNQEQFKSAGVPMPQLSESEQIWLWIHFQDYLESARTYKHLVWIDGHITLYAN